MTSVNFELRTGVGIAAPRQGQTGPLELWNFGTNDVDSATLECRNCV
jgi:hypothetical protein